MIEAFRDSHTTIYTGDCREVLRELESESVQCVVTSPPYFGLRDYGIEGQLGLEPTVEQYVANLIAVMREVRRVLRKDGTLWLNLGDSYAGSWGNYGGGDRGAGKQRLIKHGSSAQNPVWDGLEGWRSPASYPQAGLKPKDLIGVPWRVARALQEPYYTGRIKDERDRIWLAAMIDGEGCIFIHKRKIGQNNGQGYSRKSDSYGSGLEVSNVNEAIVRKCLEITGLGSICTQAPSQAYRRKQLIYRWNLRSNVCRDVLREVYPYLVAKQYEARLAIGCPSSGPDAKAAHESLMALHNGGAATIDFPAPASLYEPGWYLRSDIIWAKKNCMPESVTDRPTRSHEMVFLLTKSARYFYDAAAIREPVNADSVARYGRTSSYDDPEFAMARPYSFKQGPTGNGFKRDKQRGHSRRHDGFNDRWDAMPKAEQQAMGANKRTVWNIATQPYAEAHFATFPEELVKPCILAGTSEKGGCAECGAPWERVTETQRPPTRETVSAGPYGEHGQLGSKRWDEPIQVETIGWRPSCKHDTSTLPQVVLDPFGGSGITAVVARRAGRKAILIDVNPEYCALSRDRIRQGVLV